MHWASTLNPIRTLRRTRIVRDIDTYVHTAQQIIFVSESTFAVQETPG